MFDFPSSPSNGQVYSPAGGPSYIYTGGVWRQLAPTQPGTAEARNRIVNPCFQISQENGRGSVTNAYPADQWAFAVGGPAATAASDVSTKPNYIRQWSGAVYTTIDPNALCYLVQAIEGIRIADFLWGTAQAKPVVLRFKARCATLSSLVFGVSLRNGASTRSFVRNFTATMAWQDFTMVIPGDTTGTWPTDNTQGASVAFTVMAGSTYITATANTWVAGNLLAATGVGNLFTAISQGLDIAEVGLYLDPLATGVAPPWQMPDEAQELAACRRYYAYYNSSWIIHQYAGGAGWNKNSSFVFPVRTRVVPVVALPVIANSNTTAVPSVGSVTLDGFYASVTAVAVGSSYYISDVILNARM